MYLVIQVSTALRPGQVRLGMDIVREILKMITLNGLFPRLLDSKFCLWRFVKMNGPLEVVLYIAFETKVTLVYRKT